MNQNEVDVSQKKYTAKLREQGLCTYVLWLPKDPILKARVKKYKDEIEREFLRSNRWDPALDVWVSIRDSKVNI